MSSQQFDEILKKPLEVLPGLGFRTAQVLHTLSLVTAADLVRTFYTEPEKLAAVRGVGFSSIQKAVDRIVQDSGASNLQDFIQRMGLPTMSDTNASNSPKRRGRPKAAEAVAEAAPEITAEAPKKRGRKSKAEAAAEVTVVAEAPAPEAKKRGRKSKAEVAAAAAVVEAPAEAPKKRGRKSKAEVAAAAAAVEAPAEAPKKRGRKPKDRKSVV